MAGILAKRLVGVLAGMVTGAAGLLLLVLAWPFLDRWAPLVFRLERSRLAAWLDQDTSQDASAGYLAVRGVVGLLGGYVLVALLFVGALLVGGGLWESTSGAAETVDLRLPGIRLSTSTWIVGLTGGVVTLAVAALWCQVVVLVERRLAVAFLGPGTRELMRRRIDELTVSRLGIVRAVDDERRRIERDLHDGVQQHGVALAMLLGRAKHAMQNHVTPPGQVAHLGQAAPPGLGAAAELVEQAYGESRRLLDELRSVAWRIYPTALDDLGLKAALAGVAERSDVPVTVHHGLTSKPIPEVETALYFVAREAITNAVKHSGARDILVVLGENGNQVSVSVSDDGTGGADPAGSGLSGLARRVLALDGHFEVTSGDTGTTVRATLPCG